MRKRRTIVRTHPRPSLDESARHIEAAPAITPAFGTSLQRTPPLAWLSAVAALAATLLLRVAVPVLRDPVHRELLLKLDRGGTFALNLATLAGMVALGASLPAWIRPNPLVDLHRRLLLAGCSGIVGASVLAATIFERERTTGQLVIFAIAAAYMLAALLHASVARAARGWSGRALAGCAALMATALLCTESLDLLVREHLDMRLGQALIGARAVAEVAYLALLVLIAGRMLPGDASPRARAARLTTLFLLPVLLGAFYLAQRSVGTRDFALILYHAQRVRLWVDAWPLAYAVPVALALACAVAGALSGDARRSQMAAASILIVASGHAPQALGRVLTATLGLVLCARAVASEYLLEPIDSTGSQRGDRTRDPVAGAVDDVGSDGVTEP